jgi:hypothetical protein
MFSKTFPRLIPLAILGLAVLATPAAAAAPVAINWSVSSATAPVPSCVGGGALPCSGGTVRVTYPSTQLPTSSLPFANYPFFRQPATLTGYLDVPTSGFNSSSGCYSGVSGRFQALVARGGGKRQHLAFELVMQTSAYCGSSSAHSATGTWTISVENSEDPVFNTSTPATGSGIFTLQDSVDFTGVNPNGSFSADFTGTIAVP